MEATQKILAAITAFADQAHGDQTRKYTPDRYIVHPVRVMNMCGQYSVSLPLLAAALLHDVVEDTEVSQEEIGAFLNKHLDAADVQKTIALVVEMSEVCIKKDYPHLNRDKRKQLEIKRLAKTSPEAQTIKYADIIDNCSEILQYDRNFGHRFLKECLAILKAADRGNVQLRKRALETVEEGLETFKHRSA